MFSKEIIDNDSFTELSSEAKLLYFLLGLQADDDGFCKNAKSIMRLHALDVSALNELEAESYIIKIGKFVAIRHWKINNFIRKDRYNPSSFPERNEIFEDKETKIYYTKSEIENHPSDYNFIPLVESISESNNPKLSAENKTTETEKVNQTDDDLRKEIDAIRSKKGLPPMYG